MRFANPEFLWLLLALPLMAAYALLLRERDLPTLRFASVEAVPGVEKRKRPLVGTVVLSLFRLATFRAGTGGGFPRSR